MISAMKKLTVAAVGQDREKLISGLRRLGALHVTDAPKETCAEAIETDRLYKDALLAYGAFDDMLASRGKSAKPVAVDSDRDVESVIRESASLIGRKGVLANDRKAVRQAIDRLSVWGDFEPSALDELKARGIVLRFVMVDAKECASFAAEHECIRLKNVPSGVLYAVTDAGELPPSVRVMPDCRESLSSLFGRDAGIAREMDEIDEALWRNCAHRDEVGKTLEAIAKRREFLSVSDSVNRDGDVIYISGFIPDSALADFKRFADAQGGIGYMLSEVSDDDNPPTLLKNNRYASLLKPVIDILGLFPGYRERDISFWFLSFFAVFFALIIGDAAYGLIFVGTGVFLRVRQKKATNLNMLVIFLGAATLVWGAMTGTWFASQEILEAVPLLKRLVVPKLTNFPDLFGVTSKITQNSTMRLCFSLGAFQLLLACVMNVLCKAKDKNLSLFADIGWFLIISSLYVLVLYLLIAGPVETAILKNCAGTIVGLIVAGFALIVLFGGQSPDRTFVQGLKSGLADLFTNFLNVVSAFGNVMSYIRLFAVGMASVAIADSFNGIARGMMGGALVPVGILVLVIGHSLNLVMGLLSVIVHGVRLNVMEFSNQLGLEWSGYEYKPFRE